MNDTLDDYLNDIRAALSADPAPAPEQERAVREQDRLLGATYPGQYVAYRDIWDGGVFVRREVLAHDPDLGVFHDRLAGYPEAEVAAVEVTYCEPAEMRRVFRAGYRPKLV